MILEFADSGEEAEKAPDDCLMPHKGGVSVREVGARRRKLRPARRIEEIRLPTKQHYGSQGDQKLHLSLFFKVGVGGGGGGSSGGGGGGCQTSR